MYAPRAPGRQSISACLMKRRSQATQRGQNRRTHAVGNALVKTEACSQKLLGVLAGRHRELSTQMTHPQQQQPSGAFGSLDGDGAGDHQRPHRFRPTSRAWRPASGALGWRPRASVPYAGEVEADGTPRSVALHAVDGSLAAAA